MKKLLGTLLTGAMLLSLVACGPSSKPTEGTTSATTTSATDGVYEVETKGHNDAIKMSVEISGGKIAEINVLEHHETPGISDLAFTDLINNVIAYQSIAVDAMTGCTVSSNAVLKGVESALTAAGANLDDFSKKPEIKIEKEEDKVLEADVVVIGGGGAGLSAAVSALENGASVIVLEKMPVVGGNIIRSAGYYNAVDPKRQDPLGIEDSIELHVQQTYEGGDKVGDLDLIQTFVENCYPTLEWLEGLGMKFKDTITACVGAIHERTHTPVVPLGSSYIETYMNQISKYDNAQVLVETKAKRLIVEDGKVVGVEAEGKTGNTITVHAKKGVIMATGGFSASVEMRQKYNTLWPTLDASLPTTNHAGATGDGIVMAEAVGANLVGMEYIQLFPLTNPANGSTKGILNGNTANLIYVNKEGKRVTDEGGRRDDICKAILSQPDSCIYTICDGQVYPTGDEENLDGIPINKMVESGEIMKADSVEELAKMIGCDPVVLQQTIDDYNAALAGEKEDEFGRTLFNMPITTAPFYARVQAPAVHHTMGGIQINSDAEVLNKDGQVIDGLWAAGEVTGGIHGSNRLGGNAVPDTAVFGRIAGRNAAQ